MKATVQLQIPTPCHENWDQMTASDQGRFCTACRKEVVDFSAMTDAQIVKFMSKATSAVCGRAGVDQLNRTMETAAPPPTAWWKYGMGMAASLLMITGRSNAQAIVKPPMVSVPSNHINSNVTVGKIRIGGASTIQASKNPDMEMAGRVMDDQMNPVPYASISVTGTRKGVAADSTGNFVLRTSGDLFAVEIVVSSVGYQPKTIQLTATMLEKMLIKKDSISIFVKDIVLSKVLLGEVTIVADQQRCSRMGGMVACVRVTSSTARLKEMIGLNEVKIYPNPVVSNRPFTVGFHVKDAGQYVLQFVDAAGRILSGKQLNLVAGKYTEDFNSAVFSAGGIYFVNLTNKKTGKMYTTRLVKQ